MYSKTKLSPRNVFSKERKLNRTQDYLNSVHFIASFFLCPGSVKEGVPHDYILGSFLHPRPRRCYPGSWIDHEPRICWSFLNCISYPKSLLHLRCKYPASHSASPIGFMVRPWKSVWPEILKKQLLGKHALSAVFPILAVAIPVSQMLQPKPWGHHWLIQFLSFQIYEPRANLVAFNFKMYSKCWPPPSIWTHGNEESVSFTWMFMIAL